MRSAFRIVAGVFGIAIIGLSLPFTIASFVDDSQAIHRLHNVAGMLGFGVLLGGSLLVMARDPGSIGPFWVATASGVATTLAGLISGDFISGVYYTAPIGIVLIVALHPDRRALLDVEGVDVPTFVLALAVALPAVMFALTQAELQVNGDPSDPHVEFHHYSGMASYALALPLAAFAASLRVPGRRAAVWIVGLVGAGLGIASLALGDHVGAFDTLWAWLALAWGIGVIGLSELPSRERIPEAA